jgi:hypothetical protein
LLSDLSKFARDLFEVPIRLLGQIQGSLLIASLLTAAVAKLTYSEVACGLTQPTPEAIYVPFPASGIFWFVRRLLDQGASPPKMKKRSAKALKVRAEYEAATQNELLYFAPVTLFGVNEWTAFHRAIKRRFSQIRRERVAQKQRWRADRECPKAVPELVRLSASCPPLEHSQPQ